MGKDWGQLDRVPSKGGKSYQLKQEGRWWQRSQSPERFEDEYGELDSAFTERPTPGGEDKGYFEGSRGNKGGLASGQSKSSSVRRTRRDDFELESSREEKDRAYMHDSQNRDTGMGAGFAFPREQGPLHSGVSVSQRGNEAHDYRGDMNGPGIQALVPTYREHYWQERGVVIPLRRPPEGVGVGTSIPPDKGK